MADFNVSQFIQQLLTNFPEWAAKQGLEPPSSGPATPRGSPQPHTPVQPSVPQQPSGRALPNANPAAAPAWTQPAPTSPVPQQAAVIPMTDPTRYAMSFVGENSQSGPKPITDQLPALPGLTPANAGDINRRQFQPPWAPLVPADIPPSQQTYEPTMQQVSPSQAPTAPSQEAPVAPPASGNPFLDALGLMKVIAPPPMSPPNAPAIPAPHPANSNLLALLLGAGAGRPAMQPGALAPFLKSLGG